MASHPTFHRELLSFAVLIHHHKAPVRNVQRVCGDHIYHKCNESSKPLPLVCCKNGEFACRVEGGWSQFCG
nr:hypothetical protein Iba_chr01bCG2240 [Ipomoea batatas]GMD24363.1 hypothetical protein Iba_scaffold42471CG0010 [Ipomoea batatas]GME02390.1 hypothetical protein Iba_contig4748CG0020 [Ipomoea batatas]